MKTATICLMLTLISPLPGTAQIGTSTSAPGRYAISSSPTGIYYLDTSTGELWFKTHGVGTQWQSVERPVSKPKPTPVEIPEGYVVYTAKFDTRSHLDALRPHDLVDLFVTYDIQNPDDPKPTQKTKRILIGVEVFALGANKSKDGKDNSRSVSFLLKPEEVVLLSAAEKKGTLALALRNKTDATE